MQHKLLATLLCSTLLPLLGACDTPVEAHALSDVQLRDGGVRSGMTWQQNNFDAELGIIRVGCTGCDAYDGDTPCDEALPVLCLDDTDNLPNPGIETDFYDGWSDGTLLATEPIVGLELTSLEAANELCQSEFGEGYRMAEHHDGGGGWNVWSYGTVPQDVRMWTYINDQDANCWDPFESTCDDSDGDGVCDEDDECPVTLPDAAVDGSGCAGVLVCKDDTISPSCTCGGPKKGCCSWHGGVAGCG